MINNNKKAARYLSYRLGQIVVPQSMFSDSAQRIENATSKLNASLSIRLVGGEPDSLAHMIAFAVSGSRLCMSPLHGVVHWASVFRNAVAIAHCAKYHHNEEDLSVMGLSPIDFTLVALLFSLFHDCRRHSEGSDDTHGAYGAAALASYVRYAAPLIEYDIAIAACAMHTVVQSPSGDEAFLRMGELNCFTPIPIPSDTFANAIGMCLNADRIDLSRPGLCMVPDPYYLHDHNKTLIAFNKLRLDCMAWHTDTIRSELETLRA